MESFIVLSKETGEILEVLDGEMIEIAKMNGRRLKVRLSQEIYIHQCIGTRPCPGMSISMKGNVVPVGRD